MFGPNKTFDSLLLELNDKSIRFKIYEFPSGCKMVDIWYKDLFYVIQIEPDFAGISLFNDKNPDLDTVPDSKFYNTNDFIIHLKKVLNI